jgi:hypothetical protein
MPENGILLAHIYVHVDALIRVPWSRFLLDILFGQVQRSLVIVLDLIARPPELLLSLYDLLGLTRHLRYQVLLLEDLLVPLERRLDVVDVLVGLHQLLLHLHRVLVDQLVLVLRQLVDSLPDRVLLLSARVDEFARLIQNVLILRDQLQQLQLYPHAFFIGQVLVNQDRNQPLKLVRGVLLYLKVQDRVVSPVNPVFGVHQLLPDRNQKLQTLFIGNQQVNYGLDHLGDQEVWRSQDELQQEQRGFLVDGLEHFERAELLHHFLQAVPFVVFQHFAAYIQVDNTLLFQIQV